MVETFYTLPGAPYLALLGDFHNGNPDPILTSLKKHMPSVICIAGDLIYAYPPENSLLTDQQKNVLPFLKGCAEIAPAFMCLGNHESILGDEDLDRIRQTGVILLDNEWTEWNGMHIGGLTSHYVLNQRASRAAHTAGGKNLRDPDPSSEIIKKPDLSWVSATLPSGYKILLCHHPEYLPLIPSGIDLICAAHAHGGQWRLFGRGLFAPGQGWFPKYTSGIYEGRMVVTRGLTNMARVPRINNPTEVVYINR